MVGTGIAAVVTVAMAVACLYCAYELWTRGSIRAWLSVAVMNLVMIGAHLSAPGHHHGSAVVPVATPSTLMTVATALAVTEATIAAAVLYVQSRRVVI